MMSELKGRRGQSLVEFAPILDVLVWIFFGDCGLGACRSHVHRDQERCSRGRVLRVDASGRQQRHQNQGRHDGK